jgi:hypothetical protein
VVLWGGLTYGLNSTVNGRDFWTGQIKPSTVIAPVKPLGVKPLNSQGIQNPSKLDQVNLNNQSQATHRLDDGLSGTKIGQGDFAGKNIYSGRVPHIGSGQLTQDAAISSAQKWLQPGYTEVSQGRFVSADGLRQIRFGFHETSNPNNLHIHFEAFNKSYWNGGRIIESTVTSIVR